MHSLASLSSLVIASQPPINGVTDITVALDVKYIGALVEFKWMFEIYMTPAQDEAKHELPMIVEVVLVRLEDACWESCKD